MASKKARVHARRFLDKTDDAGDEVFQGAEERFLKATEEFILLAAEEDGTARELLGDVVRWIDQHGYDQDERRELRDDDDEDDERVPHLTREDRLALSAGYLRATKELADPVRGPRILEALRHPDKYRDAFREQLGELEGDFKSALLGASARRRKKDKRHRRKSKRGSQQLRGMENRLREIDSSARIASETAPFPPGAHPGGGSGGTTVGGGVGVGAAILLGVGCYLTAWWCIAAAGVFVIVVLGFELFGDDK